MTSRGTAIMVHGRRLLRNPVCLPSLPFHPVLPHPDLWYGLPVVHPLPPVTHGLTVVLRDPTITQQVKGATRSVFAGDRGRLGVVTVEFVTGFCGDLPCSPSSPPLITPPCSWDTGLGNLGSGGVP